MLTRRDLNVSNEDLASYAQAFNRYISTEDGSLVTMHTPILEKVVYEIMVYNATSLFDIAMQAYVARFLISSGETVTASIIDSRMKKKDAYSSVRYVLLEVMLSTTLAALIFMLYKQTGSPSSK
jgi:hypothetical protein